MARTPKYRKGSAEHRAHMRAIARKGYEKGIGADPARIAYYASLGWQATTSRHPDMTDELFRRSVEHRRAKRSRWEQAVEAALNDLGHLHAFEREGVPFDGRRISVDLFSHPLRLAVFVDGEVHERAFFDPEARARRAAYVDEQLAQAGYTVLHLATAVMKQGQAAIADVLRPHLGAIPPTSSDRDEDEIPF